MWLVWIFSFQAVWWTDRFPDRLYSSETWPLKGADVFTGWCPLYSFGMKLTLIFHTINCSLRRSMHFRSWPPKRVVFSPPFSAQAFQQQHYIHHLNCDVAGVAFWHCRDGTIPHAAACCATSLGGWNMWASKKRPSIHYPHWILARPHGGWKSCNAWARRLCKAKNCTVNRKIFNYFEKELWKFSTFVCGSKLFHALIECPCDFVGQVTVTSSELSVATTLQEFPSPYSSEAVWKSFFIRWVSWAFWKSCSSSWFTRDTLRCSTVPGIILGLGAVWRSISMPSM